MNLFDFDAKIIAAIIGAAGTMIGALIQLRIAWRKEVLERARNARVTKKSLRGPVLAVCVLLLAAGVGGFAFSQYLMVESDRASTALRGELQTRLAEISATAERLEQAHVSQRGLLEAGVRRGDDQGRGLEGIAVTTIGPCRLRTAASADAAPACSEQEAVRVTVCASVPLSTAVTDVSLFARPEDSAQPWSESRVVPGAEIGRARFAEKPFERVETDQTKQVCMGFATWDSEHAYSARVVVKYSFSPPPPEAAHTAVAPTSVRMQ